MSDSKRDEPDLTIVGGQPTRKRTRRSAGKIKVPVGFEKALYHAARDEGFKARLLADPERAIDDVGINLRQSELAMLAALTPAALEGMIDNLVPENPRRRQFMGLVAAAAASLAAGTVAAGCDETETDSPDYQTTGADGDTDIDTDTDTDTDADTDTATDTASDTATDTDTVTTDTDTESTWGSAPDQYVDGDFEDK
jgi:hypothetical protein